MPIESFIKRSKIIHNSKFDYSDISEIKNGHTKVKIICKKHGPFFQSPLSHLSGSGCPKCKKVILMDGTACDSITEAYYYLHLKNKGIKFIHNKRYPNCADKKRFDFYIPSENKYIEVTGFDKRYRKLTPEIHKEYLNKIENKRIFVEKVLCAKFEFLEIRLSKAQILMVLNNRV